MKKYQKVPHLSKNMVVGQVKLTNDMLKLDSQDLYQARNQTEVYLWMKWTKDLFGQMHTSFKKQKLS